MSWINIPPNQRLELVDRLTERQLLIYILRLGGGSWNMISDYTGLSIRTVRTHHRRALQLHDNLDRENAA